MIYLKLFWSFFQVGLFSIGGGYAAMPLIQNQVVDINHWLSMNEFADVITISQMTPGPIAINSSTFVGIRVAGMPGAVVATLGCVFPSCIIVLFLAYIYYKYRNLSVVKGVLNGLRPAVTAMIASAGFALVILAFWNGNSISNKLADLDVTAVILFAISLVVLRKWKVNPIFVMLGAGVIGLIVYSILL
jgi:chromate transporter